MNDDNETVEVEEELVVLKPSHYGFSNATREGDTATDWKPVLVPVKTTHTKAEIPLPCGSYHAIMRPGYWESPLGMIASESSYVPLDHTADAATVANCGAAITFIGAKIADWGSVVVHAYRLELLGCKDEEGNMKPHLVRGLPVGAVLNLVHDHTGKGSVNASVVLYLGRGEHTKVLGARERIRKIHRGEGKLRVGVGSNAGWCNGIAAMCERIILEQVETIDLLNLAHKTALNADNARVFRDAGIVVESWKDDNSDVEIFSGTLLDVLAAHHQSKRGEVKYGVWSRRLEVEGWKCLEKILRPR